MKLPNDLRAFVESLNAAKAKYVIVGGYAVAFHGHPRFTGDIDIFVEATAENAERIVSAIDFFGFKSLGLTTQDFINPDNIVQFGYPPNRIDVLTKIDGVTFAEVWDNRKMAELDGQPVAFIDKQHLIQNKKASGRDKDLSDIAALKDPE